MSTTYTNPTKSPSSRFRDLLGNADMVKTAHLTMSIADRLQHEPSPGVRLAAVLSAASLALECTELPFGDAFGMCRNLMNHAEGKRAEFLAAQDYFEKEVFPHAS